MSNFAPRRSRGPVFPDLPPTLQPCAVLAAAPPPDALRTALLSSLIYSLLGGGIVALASLAPPLVEVIVPPTSDPGRVVEFDGPPIERPVTRQASPPAAAPAGTASTETALPVQNLPPETAPAGLSILDRSREVPAGPPGLPGTGQEGGSAPGVAPFGASSGRAVHDFTGSAPAILRRVDPVYPGLALRSRVQGTVVLMMVVDDQGVPMQVRVLEGHPALQEAALQAARQWRFEPARFDGQPVAASFRLTLNFRLR